MWSTYSLLLQWRVWQTSMPQSTMLPISSNKPISNAAMQLKMPPQERSAFTHDQKIEAVTTWLALGNNKQVAAVLKCSPWTVVQWKKQSWWKEIEQEVLSSRRIQNASKIYKIIDMSLDVIDDRLNNGDFVYNSKAGTLERKPVSLRDATTASNALMQRSAIIEKLQRDEKVVDTTLTIQDQLASLAIEFAKFNKRTNGRATTIEFKETPDGELGGMETESRKSKENEGMETSLETSQSFL